MQVSSDLFILWAQFLWTLNHGTGFSPDSSPHSKAAQLASWCYFSIKQLVFPLCIIYGSIFLFIHLYPTLPKPLFCCCSLMCGAMTYNEERSTNLQHSEVSTYAQGHRLVLCVSGCLIHFRLLPPSLFSEGVFPHPLLTGRLQFCFTDTSW